MIDLNPRESEWLRVFFGPGNALRWDDLMDGSGRADWTSQVLPWLHAFNRSDSAIPLVLPHIGTNGEAAWYGIASQGRHLALVAEELQAFVGPSFSDLNGGLHTLLIQDPVERAIHDRFGRHCVLFHPATASDVAPIRDALARYLKVLQRRPALQGRGSRPFGSIRADFDRALLARNEPNARRFLEELEGSGRLSGEQRKCLEVRFLAGLGRDEFLARDRGLLRSIAEISVPAVVLRDIVLALYRTHVEPAESSGISAMRSAFISHIAPWHASLFRELKGLRHPQVLTAFLLHESSLPEPNIDRANSLLSFYPGDAHERDFGEQLVHSLPPQTAVSFDVEDNVRQALSDEDYETALRLCVGLPTSSFRLRTLLRCAASIETYAATECAMRAVELATPDMLGALLPRDLERIARLRATTAGPQAARSNPSSWLRWAVRSIEQSNSTTAALADLDREITSWDPVSYSRDRDQCEALSQLLLNAPTTSNELFREALPKLIGFFVDDVPKAERTALPIYLALLKLIAWTGVVSVDELQLAGRVLERILEVGPSQLAYESALDDMAELQKANQSLPAIDWSLEMSEMLFVFPTSSPEFRLRCFMQTAAVMLSQARRLLSPQRAAFSLLAADYGCPEAAEALPPLQSVAESEETSVLQRFHGLVGIYTLAEPSGRRAKQLLNMLVPGARVELNADLVATERLQLLSRDADVFAFAWKKSSHQAFYCAKTARGTRDLLMPTGGGSASLVRTITDHLISTWN